MGMVETRPGKRKEKARQRPKEGPGRACGEPTRRKKALPFQGGLGFQERVPRPPQLGLGNFGYSARIISKASTFPRRAASSAFRSSSAMRLRLASISFSISFCVMANERLRHGGPRCKPFLQKKEKPPRERVAWVGVGLD